MVTTLTVEDHVPDLVDEYRDDEHDNVTEVLESVFKSIPPLEEIGEDGCTNCGRTPRGGGGLDEVGGLVEWSYLEPDGFYTAWYCSKDCVAEVKEEIDHYIPKEPDEAIVGGKDAPRVTLEGELSFYLDGHTRELGIDVPGVLMSPEGDRDWYVGEPVYIRHRGRIVQKGVVSETAHFEDHTALILGHDLELTEEYHPGED